MGKSVGWMIAAATMLAASGASADEASVKKLLASKYASLPSNVVVKKLPIPGLYEINLLGQEAYTNEKVEFMLVGGSLVEASKLEDLTAKRKPQFLRDFYDSLPLQHAIKTVYGKGERSLVSFEDPDCPICREQHAEWSRNAGKMNATVYTFLFPLNIHPDARRKAEFIWCQPDPSAAWSRWMGKGQGLVLDAKGALSAPASCKAGVEHVAASEKLARSLGYQETPRFIFANGLGAASAMDLDKFQLAFAEVARSKAESSDQAAPKKPLGVELKK